MTRSCSACDTGEIFLVMPVQGGCLITYPSSDMGSLWMGSRVRVALLLIVKLFCEHRGVIFPRGSRESGVHLLCVAALRRWMREGKDQGFFAVRESCCEAGETVVEQWKNPLGRSFPFLFVLDCGRATWDRCSWEESTRGCLSLSCEQGDEAGLCNRASLS